MYERLDACVKQLRKTYNLFSLTAAPAAATAAVAVAIAARPTFFFFSSAVKIYS